MLVAGGSTLVSVVLVQVGIAHEGGGRSPAVEIDEGSGVFWSTGAEKAATLKYEYFTNAPGLSRLGLNLLVNGQTSASELLSASSIALPRLWRSRWAIRLE